MCTSLTYNLQQESLVDLLAYFADWLAEETEDEQCESDLLELARRFLREQYRPATTTAEPATVGYCSYCRRELHANEPLYKEPYKDGWIWVCYLCQVMQPQAVPAHAGEGVATVRLTWQPGHDTNPPWQQ